MLRNGGSRRIKAACRLLLAAIFLLTPASADETPPIDEAGVTKEGRLSSVLSANRAELFKYRRDKVRAIAAWGLYPENYEPSDAVYGKVADGEPWTKSSGFHVSNPYLLIITTPPERVTPITFWSAHDNKAGEQQFFHEGRRIRVVYKDTSANHWMNWANSHPQEFEVRLWATNAHDAGFQYAMVDTEKSSNIDIAQSGQVARAPTRIKSFFHYGENVSANNLSPSDANMRVRLANGYRQPTKIYVKLWRQKPPTTSAPENYGYVIEVRPNPNAADYERPHPFEGFWIYHVIRWLEKDISKIIVDILSLALNILIPLGLLMLGFFIGRHKEKRHYQSIRRREEALLHIPATTSWHHDTEREIEEVRLVFGSTAVSVDYFKRLLAFFRNLIGGEVKAYGSLVDRARREAILRMKESYPQSDAFINCRLATSSITTGRSRRTACVEVIAYATALRYRR